MALNATVLAALIKANIVAECAAAALPITPAADDAWDRVSRSIADATVDHITDEVGGGSTVPAGAAHGSIYYANAVGDPVALSPSAASILQSNGAAAPSWVASTTFLAASSLLGLVGISTSIADVPSAGYVDLNYASLVDLSAVAGTVITDHGGLGGLTDDDHVGYLLATGARSVSGNMIFSAGLTIGTSLTSALVAISAASVLDTAIVTAGYLDALYVPIVDAYVHPNHSGDVDSTGDGATVIGLNKVSNAKAAQMASNTVKANATGFLADAQDVAVGQNTVLGRVAGNIVAATLVNDQITNATIANAKLANMVTATFKGRTSVGAGAPEDLSATQATAMLNVFGTLKGLVPGTPSDTVSYLRADGTWVAPSGTTDHGALGGLGDDDHTQYLRADGTRDNTGTQVFTGISLGGRVVTSIQIAADGVGFIFDSDLATAAWVDAVYFRKSAAANTVVANATAGTAAVAGLTVGTNTVVGRVAGDIVSAQIVDAQITAATITNAKLAVMAANTAKVNATVGSAVPTDLAIGTNTVLGRVAGNIVAASLVDAQITAATITNAKLATMLTNTVKANATAGTAVPTDVAVGANTVLGRVAGNIVAATLVDAQITAATISNAKLATTAANTVKSNATAGVAVPSDLAMGASTMLARLDTGNIVAATPAQIRTLLSVTDHLPPGYLNGLGIAFVTTTQVSIAAGWCLDSTDTTDIGTSSPLTISTATSGANGYDAAMVSNNWYAIYIISGVSGKAGLISRSFTTPAMPSGYTVWRRVGAVYYTTVLLKFYQRENGRTRRVWNEDWNGSYGIVLNAGTVNGWTTISCATPAPPTATALQIYYSFLNNSTTARYFQLRLPSATNDMFLFRPGYISAVRIDNTAPWVPCNSSQEIDYSISVTGGATLNLSLYVVAYQDEL